MQFKHMQLRNNRSNFRQKGDRQDLL